MQRSSLVSSLLAAFLSTFAAPAFSAPDPDEPSSEFSTRPLTEEEAAETEEIAEIAPSEHQGHFKLAVLPAQLVLPYGKLGTALTLGDIARVGYGFGGELSYGVGHSVELGVYGEYNLLSSPSDCPSCDVTALSAGLFSRAYLVQGLRISPWVSYGAGFRLHAVSGLPNTSQLQDIYEGNYYSFEWLRFSLGFDWYGSAHLGLGAYLSLTGASVVARPDSYVASDDLDLKNGAEGRFIAGLRLFFDVGGH